MKNPTSFTTEADLCSAFLAELPADWLAYPEHGFDILLVRRADGFQIGVEAKLKLNTIVISQALEGNEWQHRKRGPDCRAVLIPSGAVVAGAGKIMAHLALTVLSMRPSKARWSYAHGAFDPGLPKLEEKWWHGDDWHELCPEQRIKLPDFVPDVAAGASSPIRLTEWKIKAIKIAIIAEQRGFVTRADFKALKIDIRRWIDGHWLQPGPNGFTIGSACSDFRHQHPIVYEQIAAESTKWMPAQGSLIGAAA